MRIAMVAGEASGDLLASHLIEALRGHFPQARFYGIGGPKMQATGFDALWPAEKLAVNGLVEVLRHFRELWGIRSGLRRRLLADRPDMFIGIDAPDFNLALEAALKRRGIPTVHYVSPSVWAWRGSRIKRIGVSVSHMLALFPFEPALYREQGIPVSFVGHPLADMIPLQVDRSAVRDRLELPKDALIFALLPGSRQSEVRRLAAVFVNTAKLLALRFPRALFLVPLISRETREIFERALHEADATDLPLRVMFGHAQDALAAADAVLVASGTATLEAALMKRPMVVAYKVAPASARMWRRLAYLPYVALPNVLARRFVVPELLQDEATPENLAQALGNLVCDADTCARLVALFDAMHHELRQNTTERAAQAILPILAAHSALRRDPVSAEAAA